MATEGLPELVDFGDVDGDGLRDILLVTADESMLVPLVLLVETASLAEAPMDSGHSWQEFQVRYDATSDPDSCISRLRPSIEREGASVSGVIVASEGAGMAACRATQVRLTFSDGRFTRPR